MKSSEPLKTEMARRSGKMAGTNGSIILRERDEVELSREEWRSLSTSAEFWELVDSGILGVSQKRARTMRLIGTKYVGCAHVGGVEIVVNAKVEGALESLFGYATRSNFRAHDFEAPRSEFGPLIALLASRFIDLVKTYASRGRDFTYRHRFEAGTLIGGRLNIVKTLAMRSRGLLGVAFERQVISRQTPLNRAVLLGLFAIDDLAKVVSCAERCGLEARSLIELFADSLGHNILVGSSHDLSLQIERLAEQEVGDNRVMLLLAAVLVARRSVEFDRPTSGRVPQTWFLNLESLFEAAIRNVFTDLLLGKDYVVDAGTDHSVTIFSKVADRYRAHPDIVLSQAGSVRCVGDVKYKKWDAEKTHMTSDLYQLLAHSTAFGSGMCFLVFPNEKFDEIDLGMNASGIHARTFAVDVARLPEHVQSIVTTLGISQ